MQSHRTNTIRQCPYATLNVYIEPTYHTTVRRQASSLLFILILFFRRFPFLGLHLHYRPFQCLHPAIPIPRNFLDVPRRDFPHPSLRRPFPNQRLRGHGEPHISRPIHEFENGRRSLIVVAVPGLDAQDAGVAARAREVAFADGGEQSGEDEGGLLSTRSQPAFAPD